MAKTLKSKSNSRSINQNAPSRPSSKQAAKFRKADVDVTAGGKGDKDGKGDVQAKKAGTSIGKRTGSK